MLLKAMKEYGVRHRPNEMLRHAFEADAANHLLAEGVSQPDVSRLIMAMMGHTVVKAPTRYIRLATVAGLEPACFVTEVQLNQEVTDRARVENPSHGRPTT